MTNIKKNSKKEQEWVKGFACKSGKCGFKIYCLLSIRSWSIKRNWEHHPNFIYITAKLNTSVLMIKRNLTGGKKSQLVISNLNIVVVGTFKLVWIKEVGSVCAWKGMHIFNASTIKERCANWIFIDYVFIAVTRNKIHVTCTNVKSIALLYIICNHTCTCT